MSDQGEKTKRERNSWRGAVIGALIGAFLRPFVIILFFFTASPGPNGGNAVEELGYRFGLLLAMGIAAFNGIWIGAVAGAMTRPTVGAGIGCVLSASTCGFYCGFRLEEFAAWIGTMGIAGALAGACGSAAGWSDRKLDS